MGVRMRGFECNALMTAIGLQFDPGRSGDWEAACPRELVTYSWFPCSNCAPGLSQPSGVANGDPMRRFEELCDLIAIERDLAEFSALVTELNELDPTRRLPVISRQPIPSYTLQN